MRIRDAALRQFAAHGFKGATIRGIAQEAGVSPGLVQHHFPSKQALRDECDAYVLAVLRDLNTRGVPGGAPADAAFVAGVHRDIGPLVPYLATSLVSDTPATARWFDELAELYHRVLTSGETGPALPEGEDVQAIVAAHTAMQLGLAILAGHVYRRLGADAADPSVVARIGRARLFLATERMVDEGLEADIRKGLDRYQQAAETAE
jgi:AcrR family transcriptional regulator